VIHTIGVRIAPDNEKCNTNETYETSEAGIHEYCYFAVKLWNSYVKPKRLFFVYSLCRSRKGGMEPNWLSNGFILKGIQDYYQD
jgi:hypothetical protein